MATRILRGTHKTWCQCRRQMSSFTKKLEEEAKHAISTMVTWRRISLFIAIPVCGYLGWKNFIAGEEHHEDHEEYIPWPHLRIRNKLFPWGDGDTSLFHNPHTNVGPEKLDKPDKKNDSQYNALEQLWIKYLFEDPEERDRQRWKHLARMQRRRDNYLKKKAAAINKPLQPMDLFTEFDRTIVNHKDSGMEN